MLEASPEYERWNELNERWESDFGENLDEAIAKLRAETDKSEETQARVDGDFCTSQRIEDSLTEYFMALDNLEWRSEEQMPSPTKPLPLGLFDEGYDVWIDGNRGTVYQYGDKDRSSSDTWQWDFREMALEDQVAQIEFITSVSEDYDYLSYIGYSLGTRQMYWLMNEANTESGSQAAKNAIAKVDRFLSMTVCPYGKSNHGPDQESKRYAALESL